MVYITLVNKSDCTTSGSTNETSWPGYWTSTSGKLTIVMNGTASQSFTSQAMQFFGGVKAMSGTLRINFNQDASKFWYYIDTAKTAKMYAFTKSADTSTAFSHGKLEMLGGEFSSSVATNSYGAFRFTDIEYTSGTIKLRLDSATKCDSLDLQSYYTKADNATEYTVVAGGTLTKLESENKVTFNFGENLSWLVNVDGDGQKITSWDKSNKTTLVEEDFAANKYTDTTGTYVAEFAINDDGLYVKYVSVPEPAEWAAILGMGTLLLAIYRRRK